jgi:hypothetical protein
MFSENKIEKQTFEDVYPIIKVELEKKRHKWTLTSLPSISYDDVSQIILLHIWKKFNQWDQSRPIVPWLSSLIHNQIRNLIRNNYSNYTPPCFRCDAALPDNGCKIHTTQCKKCPLFAEWVKRKQVAQFIKMPVSLDDHINEVSQISEEQDNFPEDVQKIHTKMKQVLKPFEWGVYEGLFVLNEDEKAVAKKLGYISNEKGRGPGYKQIFNIKRSIIEKVKKYLKNGKIDL